VPIFRRCPVACPRIGATLIDRGSPSPIASLGGPDLPAEESTSRWIDRSALAVLQLTRDRPGKSLIVRSAYRGPMQNRAVGGATRSERSIGAAFEMSMAATYLPFLKRSAHSLRRRWQRENPPAPPSGSRPRGGWMPGKLRKAFHRNTPAMTARDAKANGYKKLARAARREGRPGATY
jgi:hypothetical protein